MADKNMNNEFGDMIKKLRRMKKQINNNQPWTQDDLAVAIGSDKAHICRLEKGKQLPNLQTIERLINALELDWNQQKKLMALSGQLLNIPTPDYDEIQNTISKVRPILLQERYPYTLRDNELKIWDLNDLQAVTFYGYPSAEKFLYEWEGLPFIEVVMSPFFYNWFSRILVNFSDFFDRQVMRFAEVFYKYQKMDEYKNMLTRFLKFDAFRISWQNVWENNKFKDNIVYIDHQILDIDHPEIGRHSIQIWQGHFAFDNRIGVSVHIPNDDHTREMFECLLMRSADRKC